MAHEKPTRRLVEQRGRRSRTLCRKLTNANAKYLLVREGAENNLFVLQCTFVHAAAYCHTRDATQRCQFGECCGVHKSALKYKEIIFSTFS